MLIGEENIMSWPQLIYVDVYFVKDYHRYAYIHQWRKTYTILIPARILIFNILISQPYYSLIFFIFSWAELYKKRHDEVGYDSAITCPYQGGMQGHFTPGPRPIGLLIQAIVATVYEEYIFNVLRIQRTLELSAYH